MLYDSIKETLQYAVPTSMVTLGSIATGTMYDADLWVPVSGTALAVGGLVGLLRKLQDVQVYENTEVPTEELYRATTEEPGVCCSITHHYRSCTGKQVQ